MEKVKCALCEVDVLVTESQKKRFDDFACAQCYDKARKQIFSETPESQQNFFAADEFRLNGRRCGVSYMRTC